MTTIKTSIVGRFRAWVTAAPHRTALVCDSDTLTYGELDAWSDRVAAVLAGHGVAAGNPVAVAGVAGFERVAMVLGVFKAGAVFVPLSIDDGAVRRAEIIGAVGASVMLVDQAALHRIQAPVPLVSAAGAPDALPPADCDVDPRELGFVFFTSGSTGKPKGIDIAHRSMLDYLAWTTERFDLREGDRVIQLSPFNYDISLWETLWPLTRGAALVLVPEERRLDTAFLAQETALRRVTHIHLTPPLLRHFVRERSLRYCRALRIVLTSSDVLPTALMNEALDLLGDRRLFHIYGVTEVSVESSAWLCSPLAEDEAPRMGSPVTGTRLMLLDEEMRPVGPDGEGELYISSPGVAIGYRGQPADTAAAFVPDPFAGRPGARMYRTRDRARRVGDDIVLLGRVDRRVKVRGHLVDLDAVEAVLAQHPHVETAIAMSPDAARLDVYLLPTSGATLDHQSVTEHAAARLPGAANPNNYFVITDIPQTWNGKIDRKHLADSSFHRLMPSATKGATAADGDEERLRVVIADALGLPGFGVTDDFFAAGGHSLLAMTIAERALAKHGLRVHVPAFFRHRTVREMVRSGAVTSGDIVARRRVARDAPLPLSPQQLGVWLAQQRLPDSPLYNTAVALRVGARLEPDRMHRILDALLRRQETLRTRIVSTPDGPRQVIDRTGDCPFTIVDCGSMDEAQAWLRRDLNRTFDLAVEWPFRALLLRLPDGGDVLTMVLHHVATDGVSCRVLIDEIAALHDATGEPEPPGLGYVDLLPEPAGETDIRWWQEHLAGAKPLTPAGPGSCDTTPTGFAATVREAVPQPLVDTLERLAGNSGTTLFTVFHALCAAYLGKLCGQSDVIMAVPMSVRPPEAERLVGHFIQTVLTRIDLAAQSDLGGLIATSGRELAETFARASVSTADLALHQHKLGDLLRVLVGIDEREPLPQLAGAPVELIEADTEAVDHDLELTLVRADGSLRIDLTYATDLFDERWGHDFLIRFLDFVRRLSSAPATLGDIDVLTAAEHRALDRINEVRHRVDACCVLCEIAGWADRRPGGLSLSDGTGLDTYRSMWGKANAVAGQLRAAGVDTGDVVAVRVDRSRASVITMLGVMLAGAVYLPLRHETSDSRIRELIGGAKAKLTVNCVADAPTFPDGIDLTPSVVDTLGMADTVELPPGHPRRAAYLLYTSGTTGRPNGVLVSHDALVNRLSWARDRFAFGPDDIHVQKTALDFDVSLAEILQPLVSGGTLVLLPPGVERDPTALARALARARASVVHFVPSALRAFLASGGRVPTTVRQVLCSGEGLPRALVRALLDAGPRLAVDNLYGPTEATIEVTAARAHGMASHGYVPIGTPIWNTRVEVLDADLRRVAPWVPGQLFLGGLPLSVGYLGNGALTAEKFVPDPFSGQPGARLYATGDRVCYDPNGTLHYLDRLDRQTKVRGNRVELGAVEALLNTVPGVNAAAALVEIREGLGDALVSYVETDGTTAAEIRARLTTTAPKHLVPDRIIPVDRIPLTSSGKLDRRGAVAARRLRDEDRAVEPRPDGPPQGSLRHVLTAFVDLLERDEVDPDDDFFDLGGHSLLAAQVAARLSHELGVAVSPVALFDHPTPRALAAHLPASHSSGCSGPARAAAPLDASFPLSRAQMRMWLSASSRDAGHDNDVATGWLFPAADGDMVVAALARVVRRHGILRTSFHLAEDGPRQTVHADWQPTPMQADNPDADALTLGRELLRRLRVTPFDLAGEPCVAVAVGRCAEGVVAVVNVHHILLDGWSLPLLATDLHRELRGMPGPPAPQYADHVAAELARPVPAEGLDYWRHHLRGAPELELPGVPPHGVGAGSHEFSLPDEVTAGLREATRAAGGTLYSALYAACAAALFCLTRQDDLVITADVANRFTPAAEATLGFFVNQLPLRVRLATDVDMADLLRRSVDTVVDGLRHQEVPFDAIVEAVNPARRAGRIPMVRAKVVLQNTPTDDIGDPGMRELTTVDEHASGNVPLQVVWEPHGDGLLGALEWARTEIADDTAARFLDVHRRCLEALAWEPKTALGELAARFDAEARGRITTARRLHRN